MRKKASGNVAMTALCALCFGGILAMVSQREDPSASAAPNEPAGLSLDPGPSASRDLGGIVPATLERGALLEAAEASKRPPAEPTRLRLK